MLLASFVCSITHFPQMRSSSRGRKNFEHSLHLGGPGARSTISQLIAILRAVVDSSVMIQSLKMIVPARFSCLNAFIVVPLSTSQWRQSIRLATTLYFVRYFHTASPILFGECSKLDANFRSIRIVTPSSSDLPVFDMAGNVIIENNSEWEH